MRRDAKSAQAGLAVVMEAVETLSSIADLQIDGRIAVSETKDLIIQNTPVSVRSVHWLHKRNAEKVMQVARETFRVILNYLRNYYRKEYGKLIEHESIEGIKTIMTLVKDAAVKLDKYSRVLTNAEISIKKSKEFQDLDYFYSKKIAPIAIQESLTRWLRMLPIKAVISYSKDIQPPGIKPHDHLYIDLDSAKKDSEYELFLLRKDDGARFYSPRLLRNLKLITNFEAYFGEAKPEKENELHSSITYILDKQAGHAARDILHSTIGDIFSFLKIAKSAYDSDIAKTLFQAVTALLLASHEIQKKNFKHSQNYFSDFIRFLRLSILSKEYEQYKFLEGTESQTVIVQLIDSLCYALYTLHTFTEPLEQYLEYAIGIDRRDSSLVSRLTHAYQKVQLAAGMFDVFPIVKSLEALQDFEIKGFDPLLLGNMPGALIGVNSEKMIITRLATPTFQDYVSRATPLNEWLSFLDRAVKINKNYKQLIINLQDRTSWKEYARCHALEDMCLSERFKGHLFVVTMSKDSDFYHQIGHYQDLNETELFIEHLLEHVESEVSGYAYPEDIRKQLFPKLARLLAHAVSKIFFNSKNVLSRNNRLDFIEIYYLLLQAEIINIIKPNVVSFTCKDAIDVSMPSAVLYIVFSKLLQGKELTLHDEKQIIAYLLGTPLAERGRALFEDRFMRMLSALKIIEAAVNNDTEQFQKSVRKYIPKLMT